MGEIRHILGAAAGAALLAIAGAADALTVELVSDGSTVSIDDGSAGDLDGQQDGVIRTSLLSIGNASAQVAVSTLIDAFGKSELSLNVIHAITATEDLTIRVGHTGFVRYVGLVTGRGQPTAVNFKMNASHLAGQRVGGQVADSTLSGRAAVDNNGVLYSCGEGCFGIETLAATSDGIDATVVRSLSDPFSMGMTAFVSPNTETSFDATIAATIPTPAAGLALLTALGGLGIARRRRKAA